MPVCRKCGKDYTEHPNLFDENEKSELCTDCSMIKLFMEMGASEEESLKLLQVEKEQIEKAQIDPLFFFRDGQEVLRRPTPEEWEEIKEEIRNATPEDFMGDHPLIRDFDPAKLDWLKEEIDREDSEGENRLIDNIRIPV